MKDVAEEKETLVELLRLREEVDSGGSIHRDEMVAEETEKLTTLVQLRDEIDGGADEYSDSLVEEEVARLEEVKTLRNEIEEESLDLGWLREAIVLLGTLLWLRKEIEKDDLDGRDPNLIHAEVRSLAGQVKARFAAPRETRHDPHG